MEEEPSVIKKEDISGNVDNLEAGKESSPAEDTVEGSRDVPAVGYAQIAPGQSKLIDVQGQIYVVPTPAFRNGALDPADPLNWSPARKWTIVALLILWSASALSVQSFLTNFLPSVEERFPNASASQVNLLITIVTPMICPGQLFFTPLAIHYGRRFSLLLSIVLLMVSTIWGACSTSYSSLLGARIVEGLAGGPTDALGFTIVQDFAFQHQRGKMLGAIMMGQQALTLVLAIVTNYMAVTTGFRSPFYLFFALAVLVFVLLFFLMPETRFSRPATDNMVTIAEHQAMRKSIKESEEYPPFTLKRQLNLISPAGNDENNNAFVFLKQLLIMFVNPITWWAGLLNAVMTGALIAFSTYFATMLVEPPWSWSAANIGLINIGAFLTSILNIFLLGVGSDWSTLKLAKRNKGIARPEHRLLMLAIPVLIGFAANIGFGALAQRYFVTDPGGSQPHWMSLVVIFALQYMSFGGILEVSYTYMASVNNPAQGLEAMTAVSLIRDLTSFGMSYGVVGFAEASGYLVSFSVYGALIAGFGSFGIVVYIYGDKMRSATHK